MGRRIWGRRNGEEGNGVKKKMGRLKEYWENGNGEIKEIGHGRNGENGNGMKRK